MELFLFLVHTHFNKIFPLSFKFRGEGIFEREVLFFLLNGYVDSWIYYNAIL